MTVDVVSADAQPPQPPYEGINMTYVRNITERLSNVIFNPAVYNQSDPTDLKKGRAFGSKGEQFAAEWIIKFEMEKIFGADNVTKQPILATPEHAALNSTIDILSFGLEINGTRINDFHITPQWTPLTELFPRAPTIMSMGHYGYAMNTSNATLFGLYNSELTLNISTLDHNSLPVYHPRLTLDLESIFDSDFFCDLLDGVQNCTLVSEEGIFMYFIETFEQVQNFTFEAYNVSDNSTYPDCFNGSLPESPCSGGFLFIEEDRSYNPNYPVVGPLQDLAPPKVFKYFYETLIRMVVWKLCWNNLRGLIRFDYHDDVYNMFNSKFPLPIIFVNGSTGLEINNTSTVNTPSPSQVHFWINQSFNASVVSYNVIGELEGKDNTITDIVGCLYDGWYNCATADSAIGVGMMLGIAKFMKDNDITPKHKVKFIAYGGEEAGYLGAYYFEDTCGDTIQTVIDLNQLGFSQTGPLDQTFFVLTNKLVAKPYIKQIVDRTNYCARTGTEHLQYTYWPTGGPSDDSPFAWASLPAAGSRECITVLFLKDLNWTMHHRTGENHTKGDTMDLYNETDVLVTTEMIWNATRYYLLNPDCWFEDCAFTQRDTNEDSSNDTVDVTFTVNTSMPEDRVWVKAALVNVNHPRLIRKDNSDRYRINASGIQDALTVTLPINYPEGFYRLEVYLFNSTGDVDRTCSVLGDYWVDGYYSSDSFISEPFYLHPPNQPPTTPQQPSGETSAST